VQEGLLVGFYSFTHSHSLRLCSTSTDHFSLFHQAEGLAWVGSIHSFAMDEKQKKSISKKKDDEKEEGRHAKKQKTGEKEGNGDVDKAVAEDHDQVGNGYQNKAIG